MIGRPLKNKKAAKGTNPIIQEVMDALVREGYCRNRLVHWGIKDSAFRAWVNGAAEPKPESLKKLHEVRDFLTKKTPSEWDPPTGQHKEVTIMEIVRLFDRDTMVFADAAGLKKHADLCSDLHKMALATGCTGRIFLGLQEGERVEVLYDSASKA